MRQLKRHVSDPVLLNLVRQYLHYSVERGGEFYTPQKGICRGCALSPLLAGFCLWAMDTYFEAQQPHLRYVRFMDDIVIFTRTRWHLRRAVRTLNVFFASGGYRQHPDKTFIGKTEKGFDWMGIQFNRSGIGDVAPRAVANHRQRLRRLYEQAWRYGKEKTRARVGEYVRRWKIWRKYMIPKKWEWVHESTISVFVHALLRCRALLRLDSRCHEMEKTTLEAAHGGNRTHSNTPAPPGIEMRPVTVAVRRRPGWPRIRTAGWTSTAAARCSAGLDRSRRNNRRGIRLVVLLGLLLVGGMPGAYASGLTPNCAGGASGPSGSIVYNPYPEEGNPPGMFISPLPYRLDYDETCIPAADVTTFGLIFTSGIDTHDEYRMSMMGPAGARPTLEDRPPPGVSGAGAYTIGNGAISCDGLNGVQTALIPQDMVQASAHTIYALVDCRPKTDGTVRLSVHIGNGGFYMNSRGQGTRNVNFTGSPSGATAAGTGMAALMNEGLLSAYKSGSVRFIGDTSYPTYVNRLQVRGIGGDDGLETCDIQMPGVIDFGTLTSDELDIADPAASVTTARNHKSISVVTVCQGLATATVNNGWSVTGPQSRVAGMLDSDNLGVVFGVAIVGPFGDTCKPLDSPCRRVSVGTTSGSASRNVVSGTQSTRDMQVVVAPYKIAGSRPSPGRTTSNLTLNYFYPN